MERGPLKMGGGSFQHGSARDEFVLDGAERPLWLTWPAVQWVKFAQARKDQAQKGRQRPSIPLVKGLDKFLALRKPTWNHKSPSFTSGEIVFEQLPGCKLAVRRNM